MKLFLIIITISIISCQKNNSPEAQPPEKLEKPKESSLKIFSYFIFSQMEVNSLNTPGTVDPIVAPLSHGTTADLLRRPQDIKENISTIPCYSAEKIYVEKPQSRSYWKTFSSISLSEDNYGYQDAFKDVYKNASPYGELRDFQDDGVTNFALNSLPKNSDVSQTLSQHIYHTIWGVNSARLKNAPKECARFNKVISQVIYGLGYAITLKIKFSPGVKVDDNEMLKLLRETFEDSEMTPEMVSEKLLEKGAQLEAHILYFGGDEQSLGEQAKAINCTTYKIENCRKVGEVVNAAFLKQNPAEGAVKSSGDIGKLKLRAFSYIPSFGK